MSTLEVKAIQAPTGYNLAMPAGHILQVVNFVNTSMPNTTSTSYVDMGLQASITPSSTSNKILVVANINVGVYGTSHLAYPTFQIVRDSTALSNTSRDATGRADSVGNFQYTSDFGWSYLDSPSTTSSITYKTQMKNHSSYGGTLYVSKCDITLMEVQG
jgi:hypothetical protein